MVVALGDVHVAGGVELNFVRHVQGGSGRRFAITAVGFLAVARDDGGSMRRKVEPADALIVQIAKVQRPVGPDHQTVWIVHLMIRITRRSDSDERRHGRRCRRR
jgi:hypothetical protein